MITRPSLLLVGVSMMSGIRDMKRTTLMVLPFLMVLLAPLFSVSFSGNAGFLIPVGTWARHHAPSPYLSLGTDLYQKQYASLGLALEMASFRGKLNGAYHLQVLSPGGSVKFYPLFFIKNRSIFLKETLTYSFMQRNLHDATEKGRDFGIISAFGFEFPMTEKWRAVPYLGEKHYLGGIDMFILGLEIAYSK